MEKSHSVPRRGGAWLVAAGAVLVSHLLCVLSIPLWTTLLAM